MFSIMSLFDCLSISSPNIALNLPSEESFVVHVSSDNPVISTSFRAKLCLTKYSFIFFFTTLFPAVNKSLYMPCFASTLILSLSILILFISFRTMNFSYVKECLGRVYSPEIYEHFLSIRFINSSADAVLSMYLSKFQGMIFTPGFSPSSVLTAQLL